MARPLFTPLLLARAVATLGLLMVAVGAVAFYVVHDELADARITVSDNASFLAGDRVDGPFSAFAQAQVIEKDALASTGGKTYAELDRADPRRQTAMTASFLRASLFTSVVSFGVAALVVGVGLCLMLVAAGLRHPRQPAAV